MKMLRSLASRSAALCRTRVSAYSTGVASQPSANPSDDRAKEKDPDEPLWDLKNPFEKSKRECILCANNIKVDYKNVQLLSQFVSSYTGQLYGKHITGLCEHQQKTVEKALRTAQNAGLVPLYHKDMKFIRDPQLFDPLHPQRPHPH